MANADIPDPDAEAARVEELFDRAVVNGLRSEHVTVRLRNVRRLAVVARVGDSVRAELARLEDEDEDAEVRVAAGDAGAILAGDPTEIERRLAGAWRAPGRGRVEALLHALRERFRVLDPQPGMGGPRWQYFHPTGPGAAASAMAEIQTGSGGSEVRLAGLPAELEGERLTLLAPALRDRAGDGGAAGGASLGWFEATAPVRDGRTAFDVGELPPDARELGAIWVDKLDVRLAPDPPGVGRRLLVAVGCAKHDEQKAHHFPLNLVPGTLERVATLFCGDGASSGLGYERVALAQLGVGENPTEAELEGGLRGWFSPTGLRREDVVTLWFSGHGVVGDDGKLRLVCYDSGPQGGMEAGLLGELVAGAGVERALVVADCCYSGHLSQDALARSQKGALDELVARARPTQEEGQLPDAGLVFVAASQRPATAAQCGLVWALEYALLERRLGGFAAGALDPRRVVGVANEKLDERRFQVAQVAIGPGPGKQVSPVFPNPHRRDVAAAEEATVGHIDPSARGVDTSVAAGAASAWRFSGRHAALRAVNRWIADPGAGGVCVVTGRPGSGKSALLGRIVTLSAPAYRGRAEREGALRDAAEGTLPGVGVVDCALWARQQPVARLLRELHEGLFGELPEGVGARDALATALRERTPAAGPPPLVAVDALDESTDPGAVATELADLAAAGLVRLLVGTRRVASPGEEELLAAAGPAAGGAPGAHGAPGAGGRQGAGGSAEPPDGGGAPSPPDGGRAPSPPDAGPIPPALAELGPVVLDLDSAEYFDRGDVVAYAQRTLAEGNPAYAADHELALEVAGLIAGRAGLSFLFARILAYSVARRRGAQHPSAIKLPRTLGKAIDDDLGHRLAQGGPLSRGGARQLARDLLRPLAYARGAGLPLARVWAAVATAISGRPYGDADVEQHLEVLLPYLAETQPEAMGACYRLNHDLVTRHYRNAPAREAGTEGLVTTVLEDLNRPANRGRPVAGDPPDLPPDPPEPPDWLSEPADDALRYARAHLAGHAAAAGRLDPLLGDAAFLVAADRELLLPELPRAATDRGREAAHVYQRALHRLPAMARGPVPPAEAALGASYLEMHARQQGYDGLADALAAGPADRPWRTRWARWRRQGPHRVLRAHGASVRAVAVGTLGGRAVAVTGSHDRTTRVWDLATGDQVGGPLRGHDDRVLAVAVGEVGGRAVAVTGSADGTARVWDLATCDQVGGPLRGHDGPVRAVAVGAVGGRAVAVTGSDDGTARVWDLATCDQGGGPLRGRDGWVRAVAVGEVGGRAVAVTGSEDGTARVWDLAAGGRVAELRGHGGEVWAVAAGEAGGRPVAVTGSRDGTARVWDLAAGGQVAELRGHDGAAWAVAVGEVGGRAVAVTGSWDGTARVWDLATGGQVAELGHDAWVRAVAVGAVGGRAVAVTCSYDDHTARVWDLAAGGQVAELRGHDGPVEAVAVGAVGGRAVAVTGSGDGTARVWDLAKGGQVGGPLLGHDGPVSAVAVGEAGGRPVAVTGSHDGTARVWDLATGDPVGGPAGPLAIDAGASVNALAVAPPDGILIGTDQGVMLCTIPQFVARG